MSGASNSVAIVLVNWNGWQDSIACIQSCLALDHPNVRILLCDNGSQDGSVDKILAWARGDTVAAADPNSPVDLANARRPNGVALLDRAAAERGDDVAGAELLVIETGGNLGFAGGNNVGLRWAMARQCGYAWLLNNDTVVPPNALSALVAATQADPSLGMVGSTMVEYHRPDTLQAYAGAVNLRTFKGRHLGAGRKLVERPLAVTQDPVAGDEALYPIGASILVTSAFLDRVGLMEESYFLYYEEADWVLRSVGKFAVGLAPDSLVFHKVGASAGSTPQGISARSTGFLYRSRLLIARRLGVHGMARVYASILNEAARGLAKGRTGRAIGAWNALTGRVKVPAR